MEITGKVIVKNDTKIVSEKFKSREFVIETDGNYPQKISFQLAQDKVSHLDKVNVGDTICIHFNIRGREWKSPQGEVKYFNTLDVWNIDGITKGANNLVSNKPYFTTNTQKEKPFTPNVTDGNDLPF